MNLLPTQEVESRARRVLLTRWARALVAALVVIALEAAIGVTWTVGLAERRAAEDHASEQLQAQLAEYSPIIYLRAHLLNLEDFRAQAGSNDQEWKPLIARIKGVLPPGVKLIGFRVVPGAAPVPGSDASEQVGLKGTLTFSAKATSAQADTIMQLRTVATFLAVDAGELSADPSGGLTFVTTFSADQTLYTGRFKQSGGK
jgi:hypothetical protein